MIIEPPIIIIRPNRTYTPTDPTDPRLVPFNPPIPHKILVLTLNNIVIDLPVGHDGHTRLGVVFLLVDQELGGEVGGLLGGGGWGAGGGGVGVVGLGVGCGRGLEGYLSCSVEFQERGKG